MAYKDWPDTLVQVVLLKMMPDTKNEEFDLANRENVTFENTFLLHHFLCKLILNEARLRES